MSFWSRYKQALFKEQGFWLPIGFGAALSLVAWLIRLVPNHLVTYDGAEMQVQWLEALANLATLVPNYFLHHARDRVQCGGLLAFASFAYVWPFLLAGMVKTWRDRLEGRPACLENLYTTRTR